MKTSHRLPKTNNDLYGKWMPELARYVTKRAESLGDIQFAMTARDIDGDAKRAMLGMMAEASRNNYRSQGHATRHWSDSMALSAIPADAADALFSTLQQQYIVNLNFESFGRKTYFFQSSISELLAETELNVNCEDFTLPFNACMFVYDSQFMRDALYAVRAGEGEVPQRGAISVYVNMYSDKETGLGLAISAMLPESDGVVRFMLRRQLRMAFGTTLEDALRTEWSHERTGSAFDMENIIDDKLFFGPGLAFIRAVVNSALYLTSADPDISETLHPSQSKGLQTLPKKQRIRMENEIARLSALSYIDVGKNVVQVPDPDAVERGERRLNHRIKVRSHWKWQAHGPGHSERKRIQVMPYWRGPDAAEVLHRPFIVRDKSCQLDDEAKAAPRI